MPVPPEVEQVPMPELCSQESKSSCKLFHNLLAVEKKPTVGDIIHCEDISSLQKLLRVTAYVLR